MQALFKHKILLIAIIIFLLVGAGYWSFARSTAPEEATVTKQAVSQTSTPGAQDGPGKEFVSQLLAIQNISFKLDLFRDPVFIGLQDFSRELTPQETGRPNPFAPFNDASRASSPTGTSDIFGAGATGTTSSVRLR